MRYGKRGKGKGGERGKGEGGVFKMWANLVEIYFSLLYCSSICSLFKDPCEDKKTVACYLVVVVCN